MMILLPIMTHRFSAQALYSYPPIFRHLNVFALESKLLPPSQKPNCFLANILSSSHSHLSRDLSKCPKCWINGKLANGTKPKQCQRLEDENINNCGRPMWREAFKSDSSVEKCCLFFARCFFFFFFRAGIKKCSRSLTGKHWPFVHVMYTRVPTKRCGAFHHGKTQRLSRRQKKSGKCNVWNPKECYIWNDVIV